MAAAVGLLAFGWSDTSHASANINVCQATCESNCADGGSGPNCFEAASGRCTMIADLTCSSTTDPVIKLRDGTDLDMNGHTIGCSANVDCGDAIVMEAANSHVENLDPGEAAIDGRFIDGVDCGLNSGSEVTGIRISNTIVGIRDCKTVEKNVVTGLGRVYLAGNWGVVTNGVTASSDVISENYIADKYTAVLVYGNDDVEVSENVVQTSAYTVCGTQLDSSGATASVVDNYYFGVGQAVFGATRKIFCLNATPPTGVTLGGNVCDVDHPDCATCQSSGACFPVIAPYRG
jgi:hypothetical protein